MSGFLCSMLGTTVTVSGRSAATVSVNGAAQIDTAQFKFGTSSILFDGTEDWLQIDNNPIPSSGNFTVECWVRPNSVGSVLRPIWWTRETNGTNRGGLYMNTAGELTWWNAGDNVNFTSSTMSTGNWYHIACVVDGSARRLFRNGTMVVASSSWTRGAILEIGSAKYSSTAIPDEWNGWIDEFRISNIARYTSGFTAPTSPFVNDNNTVLLLHADATDATTTFQDDIGTGVGRSRIAVTSNNSAALSTAQFKFGSSSALFDGTNDYWTTGLNGSLTFGTSDHTIEGFIRLDATPNNRNTIISNGVASFTTNWLKLGVDVSGGNYNVYFTSYDFSSGGSPVITSSVTLSTATWYHIALVRYNTEWFLYIDGTQRGSRTDATGKGITANWNANSITQLGRYSFDNGTNPASTYFDGYMDEIRISNIARYTANFTAPSAALTNDGNTVLLLHFEGTNGATTTTDDNA